MKWGILRIIGGYPGRNVYWSGDTGGNCPRLLSLLVFDGYLIDSDLCKMA